MRGWQKLTPGRYDVGYRHPDTLALCPPNPRQRVATACEADWLFYGGQVGGGKSSWLAHEAVCYCCEYPRVQAALFRRTLKDLERSLALELRTMIPAGLAVFNANLMRWEFWNGSLLWLCYCANESDVYQYQSAAWGFLGIDESTHFTEFQFRYLVTRVRSARGGVPKVVRLGANPGGVGHGWHKRMFVRPTDFEGAVQPRPEEVWRPRRPEWWPSDLPVPTRAFIPARFDDNYILKAVNPEYLANVYQLGGDKGRQLAEGDWDANESMIVGSVWREWKTVTLGDVDLIAAGLQPGTVIPWHIIPDARWKPSPDALIYGSVDYGYGAPWSFHLHAALPGGHTRTWFELYSPRVRDVDQAKRVRRTLEDHKVTPEWIVMDPAMWNSRAEMGIARSIAEVYMDEMPRVLFKKGAGGRPARMSRPNRWLDALSTAPDGFPWWTVTTACPDLIRTVPDVPWDEDDPEVEDDDAENHCIAEGTRVETINGPVPIEAIRAGDMVLTRGGYRPVIKAWQASPSREVVEIELSDGTVLSGTPDHKVWTIDMGWARFDELSNGVILYNLAEVTRWKNVLRWCLRRSKNGEESGTTGAGSTSRTSDGDASIVACGKTFAGLFQMAFKSITRMATEAITTLTTSNYYPLLAIYLATVPSRHWHSEPRERRTLLSRVLLGWRSQRRSESANTADPVSFPAQQPDDTARAGVSSARLNANDQRRSPSGLWSALAAAWKSRQRAAMSGSVGRPHVTTSRRRGRAAVYDLSVEEHHEFFANGVLVSNCYEDVGRFFEARPHMPKAKPEVAYPSLDELSRAHALARDKREVHAGPAGPVGAGFGGLS